MIICSVGFVVDQVPSQIRLPDVSFDVNSARLSTSPPSSPVLCFVNYPFELHWFRTDSRDLVYIHRRIISWHVLSRPSTSLCPPHVALERALLGTWLTLYRASQKNIPHEYFANILSMIRNFSQNFTSLLSIHIYI